MSPPNPRHRVDGWVIAIIGAGILFFVGPTVGLLIYKQFSPSALDVARPPPLTALARSVQTLDEKAAVTLAEEFFEANHFDEVAWNDVRLAAEADPGVFSLVGARATLNDFGGKGAPQDVGLCLMRGPDGWVVWERLIACDVQVDRLPPHAGIGGGAAMPAK